MEKLEQRLARWLRRVGNRRGTWQLVEAVRRFTGDRSGTDKWQEIGDFDGDLRLKVNRADLIGSQIFWRGAYSHGELHLLGSLLREDMTFFDIGANIGEFSVFAAKRLPKGRVVSFEPSRPLFELLRYNLEGNGFHGVRLFNLALLDQPGRRPLYRPPSANQGATSLFHVAGRGEPMDEAQVRTLDDVVEELDLPRLDVVKIDVEGAELGVLDGGRRTLTKFRPRVLLEMNRDTLRAAGHEPATLAGWFTRAGYRLSEIQWNGTTLPLPHPLPPFCNVLAVPEEASVPMR